MTTTPPKNDPDTLIISRKHLYEDLARMQTKIDFYKMTTVLLVVFGLAMTGLYYAALS
jgi:hypothetical protein